MVTLLAVVVRYHAVLNMCVIGDGDEDVVVSHLIGKPSLFENVGGNWNFWLRVRVVHQYAITVPFDWR